MVSERKIPNLAVVSKVTVIEMTFLLACPLELKYRKDILSCKVPICEEVRSIAKVQRIFAKLVYPPLLASPPELTVGSSAGYYRGHLPRTSQITLKYLRPEPLS
jgi:hypothetical protein